MQIQYGLCSVVKVVILISFINIGREVIAIAPRTEALETPIEVIKETVDSPYWGRRVETTIKEVDNNERVG
tara:strand:+ start:160 stop:372 length:213 start_codon:yes stop_codon:yes gene_type:complete